VTHFASYRNILKGEKEFQKSPHATEIRFNARKLHQLPYHLAQSHRWEEWAALLLDVEFIEARVALDGGVPSLLLEYDALAATNDPEVLSESVRDALAAIALVLRQKQHLLQKFRTHTLQILANEPDHLKFTQDASELIQEKAGWFCHLNKPQFENPCVLTVPTSSDILAVATSNSGSTLAIATSNSVLRLLSIADLTERTAISVMARAISFSPEDSLVAVAVLGENFTNIYAEAHGNLLYKLVGHSSLVTCCSFSSGTDRGDWGLVTGAVDATVRLWSIPKNVYVVSASVGALGASVGAVSASVGASVGASVDSVGASVGVLGDSVGASVGASVGSVGALVGSSAGAVGASVGASVQSLVGGLVGTTRATQIEKSTLMGAIAHQHIVTDVLFSSSNR
jgi:hypothetical protein